MSTAIPILACAAIFILTLGGSKHLDRFVGMVMQLVGSIFAFIVAADVFVHACMANLKVVLCALAISGIVTFLTVRYFRRHYRRRQELETYMTHYMIYGFSDPDHPYVGPYGNSDTAEGYGDTEEDYSNINIADFFQDNKDHSDIDITDLFQDDNPTLW